MFENIKIRLKTVQFFKKIFVTEKYKKFKKNLFMKMFPKYIWIIFMLCIIITIRIIFKNCTQTGVNNFIGMHFYY